MAEISSEKKERKMLFSSTMIFVLVIGYLLIVTNPPADLLQYDENIQRAVTKDNLQLIELWQYTESTLLFIVFFGLISLFIGETAASVFIEFKTRKKEIYVVITDRMFVLAPLSIFVLGLIPFPYFGMALSLMMILIGLPAFLFGMLIVMPTTPSSKVVLLFCGAIVCFVISIESAIFKQQIIAESFMAIETILASLALWALVKWKIGSTTTKRKGRR